MIKQLLCTTVLLFGATALRADQFTFSYLGTTTSWTGTTTTVTETGTITANDLIPGIYTISDITGTRTSKTGNGATLSSTIYDPPGGGIFNYNSPSSYSGVITFSLSGQVTGTDTVVFNSGPPSDTETPSSNLLATTTGTFTISRVPEPAVLSLLFLMGLGVWFLARKLPSKNAPLS